MTHCPGATAPGRPLPAEGTGHQCRDPPFPILRSAIGAADNARRERGVGIAHGNVRHEGGILFNGNERLNVRYFARERDSDKLTLAILVANVVQLR